VRWVDTDHTPGIVLTTPDGSSREPRELRNRTGRQVILVLSDCVGQAWRDGSMQRVVEGWAKAGIVTIVQPLPERLWNRSGAEFLRATVTSRPGGAGGLDLRVDPHRGLPGPLGTPVLVIRPAADWFAWWASLVAGEDHATRVVTALLTSVVRREGPPANPDAGPGEVVARFRAVASPMAFELAVRLSAAPLTLPMMEFIQLSFVPWSSTSQLAEVLLGGLLERTQSGSGDMSYDFRVGVREELQRYLDKAGTLAVLSAVGRFLRASLDAPDSRVLELPDMSVPVPSAEFARVAQKVLRSMGGDYADLAATLIPR
jgi:hypothetical protein